MPSAAYFSSSSPSTYGWLLWFLLLYSNKRPVAGPASTGVFVFPTDPESVTTPKVKMLHTIHYTLQTAWIWLQTAHWTLYTAHCILTAHCKLHTANCTLHTAHRTVHTAHYILHNAHCTRHIAHCTLPYSGWTLVASRTGRRRNCWVEMDRSSFIWPCKSLSNPLFSHQKFIVFVCDLPDNFWKLFLKYIKKIPHTGDTNSLNRCG